jgi:hypothetical protein
VILNLRGTNGSGKSHIVREVMRRYQHRVPTWRQERRQPTGYRLWNDGADKFLSIVGHYETACGGCDTYKTLDDVFEYVRRMHDEGNDVLFEGIMVSGEWRKTAALHTAGLPLRVIILHTPIDDCLAGIAARRAVAGKAGTLDPKRTIRRSREVESMAEYLRKAGVDVVGASRHTALEYILEVLGLNRG